MGGGDREDDKGVSDSECANTSRLRREDHPGANHGLPFSEWNILIGPSDWKDHCSGKDGAERYRHQNLPLDCSRPGIYEFAIPATPTDDGRIIRKLKAVCIIPVYVGAADNVRTRLQCYGRDGSHLDHGNSSPAQAGPGLFEEVLAKGYPVLCRWAPMESREQAMKKEAELLNKYDYAWNKRGNGSIRRNVLERLGKMARCKSKPPRGTRKGREPASAKNQSGGSASSRASPRKVEHPDDPAFHFPIQSMSIVPYRPRLVRDQRSSCLGNGAGEEDGSILRSRLVDKGIKLCLGHAGERPWLFTGRECPGTKGGVPASGVIIDDTPSVRLPAAGKTYDANKCKQTIQSELYTLREVKDNKETDRCILPLMITLADGDNICGLIRGDGSPCRNRPNIERRRCEEHKGQRVNGSGPVESSSRGTKSGPIGAEFSGTKGGMATSGAIIEYAAPCVEFQASERRSDADRGKQIIQSELHTTHKVGDGKETRRCLLPIITLADDNKICGVIRGDGSPCRNTPDGGRRRCDEHKGQWVKVSGPIEIRSLWMAGGQTSVCGVPMADGSICMQLPVCGKKRCEEHKGRRITGSGYSGLMGDPQDWAIMSSVTSSCCGATMRNGSPCTAAPVPGKKRCARHKDGPSKTQSGTGVATRTRRERGD